MTPIIINITFGLEESQSLSFSPNARAYNSLNTVHIDKANLEYLQKEKLVIRLNQLITNVVNETVKIDNQNFNKKQNEHLLSTKNNKQWLKKVERIVRSEISNSQFNIDSLASILNVSRSKVHRDIKRRTGLTPNKYIRQIKLQNAREILEKGEVQTVSEVCYAVGFDTPKYFSKIYEQQFGKRPLSYIRLN